MLCSIVTLCELLKSGGRVNGHSIAHGVQPCPQFRFAQLNANEVIVQFREIIGPRHSKHSAYFRWGQQRPVGLVAQYNWQDVHPERSRFYGQV